MVEKLLSFYNIAVGKTKLERRNPNDPIRRGSQHADQGDQVVLGVRSEDGKGLALDIWMPEPLCLDDRPDVPAA